MGAITIFVLSAVILFLVFDNWRLRVKEAELDSDIINLNCELIESRRRVGVLESEGATLLNQKPLTQSTVEVQDTHKRPLRGAEIRRAIDRKNAKAEAEQDAAAR